MMPSLSAEAPEEIPVDLVAEHPASPRAVVLRFRASRPFSWHPGQYLRLFIGGAPGIPYSIASAPDPECDGEFELAVSKEASAEMLSNLRRGGPLAVSRPAGDFVWRPSSSGSLFIGMGTGLAPLRAMLQAARRSLPAAPCVLLAGARNEDELLWRLEFESWAHADPSFVFEPTLSSPSEKWEGRRGRVQEHVPAVAASRGEFASYLCGNPDMVRDCTSALVERFGFERARISSEAH